MQLDFIKTFGDISVVIKFDSQYTSYICCFGSKYKWFCVVHDVVKNYHMAEIEIISLISNLKLLKRIFIVCTHNCIIARIKTVMTIYAMQFLASHLLSGIISDMSSILSLIYFLVFFNFSSKCSSSLLHILEIQNHY